MEMLLVLKNEGGVSHDLRMNVWLLSSQVLLEITDHSQAEPYQQQQ